MNDYVVPENKRLELASFLKTEREKRDLGMNQFCLKADIQSSQYSKLEKGKLAKLNPYLIQKIADGLRIDYKVLYKMIGYLREEDFQPQEPSNIDLNEAEDAGYKIPVYESVSAGTGGIEYGELLEWINIPALKNGTEVFGVKVKGDSMEYTIPNGATILVKKDVEIGDKEVGVFIVNNESYVKRFRKGDKFLTLTSDNRDYDPIIVTKNDEFFAVGKVVEVMYKL